MAMWIVHIFVSTIKIIIRVTAIFLIFEEFCNFNFPLYYSFTCQKLWKWNIMTLIRGGGGNFFNEVENFMKSNLYLFLFMRWCVRVLTYRAHFLLLSRTYSVLILSWQNCSLSSKVCCYIGHLLREKHRKLWHSLDKSAELDLRSTNSLLLFAKTDKK